jgi:hypothetical protein
VDTNWNPNSDKAVAKSTIPVLSKTLRRARGVGFEVVLIEIPVIESIGPMILNIATKKVGLRRLNLREKR